MRGQPAARDVDNEPAAGDSFSRHGAFFSANFLGPEARCLLASGNWLEPAPSVRVAAPRVAMSSASTLARRAAQLARANVGRLVGDLAVGPSQRSAHHSRPACLIHDGAAPRELAHVQPWHAFGRDVSRARNFHGASVAHRRVGDPAPPGAVDAGAGVGTDTRASSDPQAHRNAASDAASSSDASRGVPGQSRIVRVANFVARDLLSATSLGDLLAKMREHRDMAYLVATREASPFPFVFRAGCKFDERGAFVQSRRPLCGPCDAASVNAARLAEDPEARPIACTLEPRECFKTQQYTYFAAWMFLCYAGFVVLHGAAKVGAALVVARVDAWDEDRRQKAFLSSSSSSSSSSDEEEADTTTAHDANDASAVTVSRVETNGAVDVPGGGEDDGARDDATVAGNKKKTFASARDVAARYDPFGPRFLNFRDPRETWTALVAATLNFSRTAEIVRTTGLMFAYRKIGWWVVSAATSFRRHRRWM